MLTLHIVYILLVIMAFLILLELFRLLYKLKLRFHQLSQIAAYSLALLCTLTTILYAEFGHEIDDLYLSSNKLQGTPSFQVLLSDSLQLFFYYTMYNLTLNACVKRFVRIAIPNSKFRWCFDLLIPVIYLISTSIRVTYGFWLNMSEKAGCKWLISPNSIEFCKNIARPLQISISSTLRLSFAILEFAICIVLIRIAFKMGNDIQHNLKQKYKKEKIKLFFWLCFISMIDCVSVVLYLQQSFVLDIVSYATSIIHVFASFNFLAQLKGSIDMAEESSRTEFESKTYEGVQV